MSRRKRTSEILDKVTLRITGMRSIDNPLDLGSGYSLTEYETRQQTLRQQLETYNTMLSAIDDAALQLQQTEKEMRNYAEHILLATAARYGRNSNQYMQSGGKIRSKAIKRSTPPIVTPMMTLPEITNTNGSKVAAMN